MIRQFEMKNVLYINDVRRILCTQTTIVLKFNVFWLWPDDRMFQFKQLFLALSAGIVSSIHVPGKPLFM